MKYLVCNTCKNIYNSDYLIDNYGHFKCPNSKCNRVPLEEIDEMMYPTIQLLKDNGFDSKACCSGHAADIFIDVYVLFNINYDPVKLNKFHNVEKDFINKNHIKIELFIRQNNSTEIMVIDNNTEFPNLNKDASYELVFRVNPSYHDRNFPYNKSQFEKFRYLIRYNQYVYNIVEKFIKYMK